jgi:CRP/FNR family transcriptional regulator, anaerobic regulatory protein
MNMHASGRCDTCRVRHHRLCQALAAIDGVRNGRSSILRKVAAGRILDDGYRVAPTVGIIVSGVVNLQRIQEDGSQQNIGFLFPGDYVGLMPQAGSGTIAVTASTVEICCFPRRSFELLTRGNSALGQAILTQAVSDLDEARRWMRILARRSARERIASFLLMLEKRSRNSKTEPRSDVIVLPFSRTELADYLGLTLETVSRQFTQLRTSGVFEVLGKKSIRIKDWRRLEAFSEPTREPGDLSRPGQSGTNFRDEADMRPISQRETHHLGDR